MFGKGEQNVRFYCSFQTVASSVYMRKAFLCIYPDVCNPDIQFASKLSYYNYEQYSIKGTVAASGASDGNKPLCIQHCNLFFYDKKEYIHGINVDLYGDFHSDHRDNFYL